MANKVSNLSIKLQTGTDSTYLATWSFDGKTTVTTSSSVGGNIRVGSWVTIKSGATWYNGVAIPSWVFGQEWQVYELIGDRAVLNSNRSGSNHIMSPIRVSNLNGGTGSTVTTTTTVDALDHYAVTWYYDTGDGIWFSGGDSTDTNNTYATYNAPSNAKQVKVTVRPISKTRQVNGQDTPYFTGQQNTVTYSTTQNPPEVPPAPSVEIDKYTLKATVDNVSDARSDEIEFQVYDMTKLFKSGTATVQACMATFQTGVNAGGSYRVRARSANIVGSNGRVYSEWTDFTDPMITIPTAPSGITTIRGASSTSVFLQWATVNSAESYDIEYTTNVNYFDASSETTLITGVELNYYTVTGLETGDEYFFRVRAVNTQGESAWTEPKSVVIGKKPSAPTTWSSSTTVITGNPVTLYWVHNAEDGSTEEYAQVEITVGNGEPTVTTVKNNLADDEENPDKDNIKSYVVDTSSYAEGTQIKWRVRTAGITLEYGDWSIMRTVDVYAPPTLDLSITNQNGDLVEVLTKFPFFINGLAGPKTQLPIGYHVTITADSGYETVDNVGRTVIVNPGDEIYAEYIDTNDPLLLEMDPWNIDLENNVSYTLTVIVSMDSGLTTVETKKFSVSWSDESYDLDATVVIDRNTLVAYVTPRCMVTLDPASIIPAGSFIGKTDAELGVTTLTESDGLVTIDATFASGISTYDNQGWRLFSINDLSIFEEGVTYRFSCDKTIPDNGERDKTVFLLYSMSDTLKRHTYEVGGVDGSLIETFEWGSSGLESATSLVIAIYNMYEGQSIDDTYRISISRDDDPRSEPAVDARLAVYRREFDGQFTEIATGIEPEKNTMVTDPHPALDYARYRIVATSTLTGAIDFYDPPGYPVQGDAAIIQWDEEWSDFDVTEESAVLAQPLWNGSMLRLPYNLDVSDANTVDSTLVKYIGRSYPVSYYGTQIGSASTWSLEIDKNDQETLYGLRRLSIWKGDCYVREPSGTGYWANVSVSYNRNHNELTIPVTLTITRVEGGM